MKLRSGLYRIARVIGDVQAVKRRRVKRRLINRVIGRRLVSRMWR